MSASRTRAKNEVSASAPSVGTPAAEERDSAVSHKRELTDEDAAQAIVRALADPQRYKILKMLAQCATGGSPCSAVRKYVDVAPPTLSHHMRELQEAGLVKAQRSGRTVQYTLRRDIFTAFLALLRKDFLTPGR